MHVFWKVLIIVMMVVGAIGFYGVALWIRELEVRMIARVPDKLEPADAADEADFTAGMFV